MSTRSHRRASTKSYHTDVQQLSFYTASTIKPKSSLNTPVSLIPRYRRSSASSGVTSQLKSKTSGRPSPKRRSFAINNSIPPTAINRNAAVVATALLPTHPDQQAKNPSATSVVAEQSLLHRHHTLTDRTSPAHRLPAFLPAHPALHLHPSAGLCLSFATLVYSRQHLDGCDTKQCRRTITLTRETISVL